MKEDLLQYIWRSKALLTMPLHSTDGDRIEILDTGNYNTDQGPDFLYARIRCKDLIWIGHIEIHVKASDWYGHQHDTDTRFQNIILHVVWESDVDIGNGGQKLTCLELQHRTPPALLQRYRYLMEKNRNLACRPFLEQVSESLKAIQLERMMIERLQEKTERAKLELSGLQWDWDALVYRNLAHYLVAPVNSAAMDLLVEKIPLKLIMKVHHDPILLDALILGMSGLVPSGAFDDYTRLLQSNFRQLALKFKLEAMESFQWKWLRLRPPHFPDLRLAQLSAILQPNPRLWSRILEAGQLKDIHALLRGTTHPYWDRHFRFSITSNSKSAEPGVHMRDILIINVICPILFAYGSVYHQAGCRQKALDLLEKIKPESNFITSTWKKYNFALIHAGHSQGGIQLYRHYCTEKKCTSCLIGHEILRHPMLDYSNP